MTVNRTERSQNGIFLKMSMNTFEKLLFQFCLGNLNLNSLVNLLRVPSFMVGVIFDCGRKKGVDECSLAQPRFSCYLHSMSVNWRSTRMNSQYHNGKSSTTLCDNLMPLIGKVCNADWRCGLNCWWCHFVIPVWLSDQKCDRETWLIIFRHESCNETTGSGNEPEEY